MKKLLFVIPLTLLMLMVTVMVTMPTVKAQDEEEGEGEGGCQFMDASEEGWQRRVCPNSDDDSYINPNGEECFANPAVGSSACGNEVNNPNRFITP
jgi:hypothetical protein